ncbi:MAG: glycerophosphoryl diester phosphodiesterase [Paracoccaceae bacterium]|jgi:glycerophosphoryl diester phosphodiesterase
MALHPLFLTKPITHRGLHDIAQGAPENSPAAFRAAMDKGYGIELDLQCSSDGQAIVFHDYELERLTNAKGLIKDKAAAELGKIKLRDSDETIPTLKKILDTVAGQVPLLIEIKDQDGGLGRNVGLIAQNIAALLEFYPGPVAVMSYNPHAVAAVGALANDVTLGLVTSSFSHASWDKLPTDLRKRFVNITDFDESGASFISHNRNDLHSEPVTKLKARGVPVLCWTVQSKDQETQARKIADNITFEGYFA